LVLRGRAGPMANQELDFTELHYLVADHENPEMNIQRKIQTH
jgi:hypothetical protein